MSILNLAFNQETTHLTCCTDLGFIVYTLDPSLEKTCVNNTDGGVGIMKMRFKTNISILVGGGDKPFRSKDTLILWDEHKKTNLVEIDLREPIKNAFINKKRILVVLEKRVSLFDYLGTCIDEKTTCDNPNGLAAVSIINQGEKDNDANDVNFVVGMLGTKKGQVCIWRPHVDDFKEIQAHLSSIENIALNYDGSLVATSSEAGTLIRVFNTERGKKECEFRRGSTAAKIHALCFSMDSSLLACCSGNGTVHIYHLKKNEEGETQNTQSLLSGFKDYLPEYFGSEWSSKQLTPGISAKCIMAFDKGNNLHLCTFNGDYFKISGRDNQFQQVQTGHLHINNNK